MSHWRVAVTALVPVVALSIAVPFVNRIDPTLFGLPFIFVWIMGWVLVTPAFLWLIGRLEHRW